QSLINDLLRFSRETTSNEDYSFVQLNDLLNEVLTDMEVEIEKTSAQIQVGPLPKVWAIASQMRQVFQNLISNAIKFRKPDTVPVIQIFNDAQKKEVYRIVLQDNGIGFDPKYAEEIFMVFKRLHSYHEFEGSGVGLSICKKIVERHNGSIRAESRPGMGSRFLLDLPLIENRLKVAEIPLEKIKVV
ncbi:MAG: sensor histidine kinase, partial [Flavisolibacter sp.]